MQREADILIPLLRGITILGYRQLLNKRMTSYQILMILSGLVILSYLFDLLSARTKLPSVLLLLFVGIGLRQLVDYFGWVTFDFQKILPSLGSLGLILIVFEGALELKYDKEKNKLIKQTFLAALVILLATCVAIAVTLHLLTGADFYRCFLSAIPFSVISSSIAIPSAVVLDSQRREFVIYESSFSDIIGIILFNFAISNEQLTFASFAGLGGEIVFIGIIAFVSCLLLLYIMGRIQHHIKFFLIISILILIYSLGQQYHLSSLIIVLAFGLFLSNADEIRLPIFKKYFYYPKHPQDLNQLLQLSAESAFIIRTFFFVIFGFTMQINELRDLSVLQYGILIVLCIYLVRFIYLKYFAKTGVFPEALITPRGLISILLYYHLPAKFKIPGVETGLLFLVIISTCLIMSFGLLTTRKKDA
jgi:NhaP-type Na+/H+ and K+/H+ antiporter